MPVSYPTRTRAQIRQYIGRLVYGREKFAAGLLTAATSTTVTADCLNGYLTDAFAGKVLYTVSGTGSGQRRLISASTSAGVATVADSFSVTPNTTTRIEVWPANITPDRVNDCIDMAILDLSRIIGVYVDTTSPTIDSDRTQITIPTTYTHVCGLKYYDSSADAWIVYRPSLWKDQLDITTSLDANFIIVPGHLLQVYPTIPSSISDANVHVMGYRTPALPTDDSTAVEAPPDYLVYMAAFYLEAGEAEGPMLDPEQHGGRAANWYRQALLIRDKSKTKWNAMVREVLD